MGAFLLCGASQTHDLHTKLVMEHPRGTANQLHKCARLPTQLTALAAAPAAARSRLHGVACQKLALVAIR